MTMIKETQWAQATTALQNAETVVVVTHIGPDGDAIGSMMALVNALQAMGKTVDCAVDEGSPQTFDFIDGTALIKPKLVKGSWDLMISTDASDEERTGAVGQYARENSKTVINLDHHATNTLFGDIYLVDSEAVSAAEVVYRWLREMAFDLTVETAMPLLTGMVTDTIGFRTSNVTEETLGIAQELMRAGASLTEVTERTLDNRSFLSVGLWKHVLQSVQLHAGGIVSAAISHKDFKQAGMIDTNDFGLVGFLIKIEEAMIAVVMKEVEDDQVNISMRAKPGYNVSQVAFELGGGGHKQAAGATVPGPLADVKKRVLALLSQAVKSGKLVIA
jgi:bifunctional oligoribonuclease and PAP phosphatase NrnA